MKKNHKILFTFIFVFSLLTFVFDNKQVFAEGSDYSVVPLLPENQKTDTKSFYDIELTDNQPFKLSFSIENISDNKKSFSVLGFDAATNSNGIIDYSNENLSEKVDKNKRLTNYLELPTSFSVEPGETKKISFKLSPDNSQFEGYILGAIQIVPEIKKEESGITNQFTRTIAIRLWGSTKKDKINTSIIDIPKNFSVSNGKKPSIHYTLKNEAPIIEKNTVINTTLKMKNNDKERIIIEDEQKLDFAPSSLLDREQKLSDKLDDGEYIYEVTSLVNNKKKETYSYTFIIKNGDIAHPMSWLVILICLIVILVCLIIIIIYYQNRKRRGKHEEK
ncbi:WxL protein peptidoglycan domain-containing protein [Enterococcus sp. DIV1059_1]|uniref:WxL protein peptidoglycan domain-containing protein n=1 Tax=Enterococcus sp. DIV1059_1 TaxID=2774902 RepID=UPI003F25E076